MVTKLTYGSGLGEGISSLGSSIGQALQARTENKRIQDILNPQGSQEAPPKKDFTNDEDFRQNFLDMIQGYENETGNMMEPKELDLAWNASLKNANTEQHQQQQKQAGGTPQYNMSQLATIAKKNPQLAKMIQDNQLNQQKMGQAKEIATEKLEAKSQMNKDTRAFKSNEKFIDNIEKVRTAMPKKEATLLDMSRAIGSKDLSNIRNFAASYLGNKGYDANFLRTSDANDLEAAVKHEFIASTQELPGGTRLNEYVMTLFKDSLQSPLKTPENNLRITEMQRFLNGIDKEKIRVSDRIIDQYEKAGREPPANLAAKVDKELATYTQDKLKGLNQTYKDIESGKVKASSVLNLEIAKERIEGQPPKEGHIWMMFGEGVPKQVPVRDSAKWQKSGGKLIK